MKKGLKDNDKSLLREKKLYLFDMDGTIYKENELFDGVKDLLNKIKEGNGKYIFLTNNSSKSVDEYVKKLESMGINVTKEDFFTSTLATIYYLKNDLSYNNELIYAMGTEAFKKELRAENLNVVDDKDQNKFDAKIVLIGYDTELTYQKLRDVSFLLTKDVTYIATHPDLVCPTSFGFVPDCGTMCNMLYDATGKNPKCIGKPNAEMINVILERLNVTKEETVIIGDRLYTDIASGINASVDTICVLSGESSVEDIEKSQYKPTFILDSVKDLLEIFK